MHPSQYQPGQVLPGTVYRVVRHLATGGMGSVYDVEDITVEKRYVLKTLHPNLVAREDLAIRMRDEAKSLAKLQHPNIVDVVTAGVTNDAQKMPFYVMERLIGQNLRVVLEKTGVLHVPHAYRIAIDVADALEHAHENNIVHRDVKPENIFLHRNANGTTTTKLLDFGIVRLLDRKASHTHGKFIGTLRYAAPEQITGKKIGPATDIYSLAVVLFEMLCGRGPFDDLGDAYAIGAAHANTPAPPLSRFIRGASPDVERIVASALAKNPEERPRDCFTFTSELRRILREEEASPRSQTAVNLITSSAPPTEARPSRVPDPTGPTVQGMAPPSMMVTSKSPQENDVPPTRAEGPGNRFNPAAPVNPIAPTLAAAGQEQGQGQGQGQAAYPPGQPRSPIPAAGAPPPGLGGPVAPPTAILLSSPPAPSGGPGAGPGMAGGHAIDRNAPTRTSAGVFAGTRRLAPNDTQIEPSALGGGGASANGGANGLANDDVVRAALGEAAPLVVPPVGIHGSHPGNGSFGTGSSPGDLVFPPIQGTHASTGAMSGEIRRPAERGPFILVGVAAVLALAMVGGAFLLVKRPWQSAGGGAAPTSSAAAASAPAPSPPVVAASSVAVAASPEPSLVVTSTPIVAPPSAITDPPPPVPHGGGKGRGGYGAGRPVQPQPQPQPHPIPQPTAPKTAEPRPKAPGPAPTAKDVPFDP